MSQSIVDILHHQTKMEQKIITRRRCGLIVLLFLGILVSGWALYGSAYPFGFRPGYFTRNNSNYELERVLKNASMADYELERVLKNASMADKTVIITSLNKAWAEPGSLLDMFLESFRIGKGTQRLLKHLVIVSLDQKAYNRCLSLHPHCYKLDAGDKFADAAYFMTPTYLEMMWKRISFLSSVLNLGYNFVFTDTDIMWLQDPFPRFFPNADFQISCDQFNGNPYDHRNAPNGGFKYVKSNNGTKTFYRYWYASRLKYPGKNEQEVLNKIKRSEFIAKIRLKMIYLDTANFGGFCQHSKDFKNICTLHANCCFGLESKIIDLKIVLEDWKTFVASSHGNASQPLLPWRAPKNCSTHYQPPDPKKHTPPPPPPGKLT